MKKYQNQILSFFIPIIIVLIGMLFNKIYPFGDKILLMLDGYNQYPGFLNTFTEFIKGHSTILYSLKGITGFNLFASSIYYTFNITNLFSLLFKNIVNFYTFIIILKIGLASLSMNIFLNYLKKDKYNFIFSICYGLTTYNLLYYLNYMWFDSIILLPLVILGIEKIFKENKTYFYLITLTLSIISNFYIGYMICIFSLIYFIYKWIQNKFKKEYLIKFILSSISSGLLSSFILIPVILELLNGKGALFASTNYFKFDLDFLNVFYKLTIGAFLNGDLEYGTPNVYVSIFIYLNVILYFFNKNIKIKEKILSLLIILLFLFSMSFNLLDYFWQMLQMPIYYPVRYAFIFDFYLIYLAYNNYLNYKKLPLNMSILALLIMLLLISIGFITSGNLLDKINIPAKLIYLGISLIFIFYYLFIINNKDFKKYIWIVLIIELSLNTFVTLRNNGNTNLISDFNNNYLMNKEVLKKIDYNNLNRISFDDKTIKNNGLLFNYNDLNYFSSLRNKKVIDTLSNLGILIIDGCNSNYNYNNPIINALFGIKYYITKDNLNIYELKDNYNNYNIYENKDITNIAFITNKELINLKLTDNYKDNLNKIVKIINNNDKDIIKEIKVSDKNVNCSVNMCITNGATPYINYEYKTNDEEILFIQNDYPIGKDESIYKLTINDKERDYNTHYPIKLNKKDNIKINITPGEKFKDYDYHVYIEDYNVYKELINSINNNKLEITNYYNDASFKGHITLEEDNLLLTTISNDNGWTILVDGKKKEITPILDGFIGLNLSKGEHSIEFTYYPPGLKIGLIISSITLILTSGIYFYKRKALK